MLGDDGLPKLGVDDCGIDPLIEPPRGIVEQPHNQTISPTAVMKGNFMA